MSRVFPSAFLAGMSVIGLVTVKVLTAPPEHIVHEGLADASAAVLLDAQTVAVAVGEVNVIQFYRLDQPEKPVGSFDLDTMAGVLGKATEIDVEGVARIGDRIYWIGSHGRNKDGKPRPNRQRLLATRVESGPGGVKLVPDGRAYTRLLPTLLADRRYEALGLRQAAGRGPDDGGINIEGLAATPTGGLLIAFRSPLVEGKALLAPFLNPDRAMQGDAAQFGDPIVLDLDGLGFRDLVWSGREYFVVGGGVKGGNRSRLFRWSGPGSGPVAVKDTGFKHFNPEGLVVLKAEEPVELMILSDDGNDQKGGGPAWFRSFRVRP